MIKRTLLSLFLLLITAFMASLLTWSMWIFPVAAHVLADKQIELIAADIERPGWRSLTINDLQIRYARKSTSLSLRSPKVVMSFTARSLFSGKLDALTSEDLTVSIVGIAAKTPSHHPNQSPRGIPFIVPSQVLSQIPLAYINIERLALEFAGYEDFQEFTGNLRFSEGQLALTMNGVQHPLTFSLDITTKDQLNLTLFNADTKLATVAGQVAGDHFKGEMQAHLDGISEMLDRLAITPANYRLKGVATLHWSMPIFDRGQRNNNGQLANGANLLGQGRIIVEARTDFPIRSITVSGTTEATFKLDDRSILISLESLETNGSLVLPSIIRDVLVPADSIDRERPVGFTSTLASTASLRYDRMLQEVRLNNAKLIASFSHHPSGFAGQVELEPSFLSLAEEFCITATLKVDAHAEQLAIKAATAKNPQLKASALVGHTEEGRFIRVAPGAIFAAHTLNADQLTATHVNLTLTDDLSLTLMPDALYTEGSEFRFSSRSSSVANQPLDYTSLTIQLGDSTLPYTNGAEKTSFSGQLRGLVLGWDEYRVAALDIDTHAALDDGVLAGKFDIGDHTGFATTTGDFSYNFGKAAGALNASTDSVIFNESDPFLPKLISPSLLPFDLTGGSLTATTTLRTHSQGTSSSIDINLVNVSGFYETHLFKGFNGNIRIADLHNKPVIQSERLNITEIDIGTAITDVSFALEPLEFGFEIKELKAGIFGGHITQEQIIYEWGQTENYLVLNLHQLQLHEILQMESGISGSGTLGGMIPIIISKDGFSVRQGGVSAQPPGGIIRYETDVPLSASATNAGLRLTLDALQNFHYTNLSTEIEYGFDGDLLLKASLQGRNPDLDETRPFHFNLNITENIPTLLKALRFNRKLNDNLHQRINDFYLSQPQEAKL